MELPIKADTLKLAERVQCQRSRYLHGGLDAQYVDTALPQIPLPMSDEQQLVSRHNSWMLEAYPNYHGIIKPHT
jgi:hypothetical protein